MKESRFSSTPQKTQRARRLRREATPAERRLWILLSRKKLEGFRFRRQHPFGSYVLDFYCPEIRLCIELDGGQHGLPKESARDLVRDAYLTRFGIRVLRFWNADVMKDPVAVADAILHEATMIDAARRSRRSAAQDIWPEGVNN